MLDSVLDVVFPPRCAACGKIEEATPPLCAVCAATIQIRTNLSCGECRARLPNNRKICHRDCPYLLGAATNYDSPAIQRLIRALKFEHIPTAAIPLGEILARYVRELMPPPFPIDLVTAVPLGSRRERARGYNQASLIARHLATLLLYPFEPNILVRTRDTDAQSELSAENRKKNLARAFRAAPLEGRSIILVDDVVTSGATIRAAAEALKAQGAHRILALAVAEA